jgi:hypothetical protein
MHLTVESVSACHISYFFYNILKRILLKLQINILHKKWEQTEIEKSALLEKYVLCEFYCISD